MIMGMSELGCRAPDLLGYTVVDAKGVGVSIRACGMRVDANGETVSAS